MTTIAPWLSVADAAAAVGFYERAFAATVGELIEADGLVQVAELRVHDAQFWVQQDDELPLDFDPGRAVRMIIYVDDPDTTHARALAAGATEVAAVHEEHGWRTGRLVDPFGHQWSLSTHVEDVPEDEMRARMEQFGSKQVEPA